MKKIIGIENIKRNKYIVYTIIASWRKMSEKNIEKADLPDNTIVLRIEDLTKLYGPLSSGPQFYELGLEDKENGKDEK